MKNVFKIIIFIIILILLIFFLKWILPILLNDTVSMRLGFDILMVVGTLFLYLTFSVKWDGNPIKGTVLYPSNSKWLYFIYGLLFGAVLLLFTYFISKISGAINVTLVGLSTVEAIRFSLVMLLTMLLASIWEEISFRGYILPKLIEILGVHSACVVIAMIFGLLHLFSPVKSFEIVVSTFFAGLLLCYSFVATKNIYFVIGIHFSWNYLGSFLYSEKIFDVEYVSPFLAGNRIYEEGAIAIIVTAAGAVAIFFLFKLWKIDKTTFFQS